MKTNNRNRIVIGVIFAFVILSYAGIKLHHEINEHYKIEEIIKRKYALLSTNDSINSVVQSTYYPEGWRGGNDIQNIKLSDGTSYTIEIRMNITSEGVSFGNLVRPGVVLKKRIGSDTLDVIKGDKVFQYLIFGN